MRSIIGMPGGEPPTAAMVFEMLGFNSQITRLARKVIGAGVQFRNKYELEDAAEGLAREYIRSVREESSNASPYHRHGSVPHHVS